MKIDLIISADDIKENKIIGKVVVVIDMLRATTVITTAIKNGCKEVIPVVTIDEALELSKSNREEFILGGERRALKIEGFDCSNSPLDYTEEVISGKSFIITTSNGTRAINGCKNASKLLIGSLINAKAVAKKIVEFGEDVVIVNAGTLGQFSMDDFICSGYIIDCIKEIMDIELTDIAYTAHHVYKEHEDIISFIRNARHYKVIMELGLEKDLEYCCTKDITEVVPYYDNGIIKRYI
jgi:2-phosphosulfolactate phosphatase